MANWDKIRSRGKVLDRRGNRPATGLGRGMPINLAGASSGTALAVVGVFVAITLLTGGSLGDLTDPALINTSVGRSDQQIDTSQYAGEDNYEVFVSTVLGSANDMWRGVFNRNNINYQEPNLVLFRQATSSGCGVASSNTGPHYCPADKTIYIDETFFDEVLTRFGSDGGDVAEAYVIAHEVGHHAQNLLGYNDQLNDARRSGASNINELSVELELQADCFAGLWAAHVNEFGVFQPDEIEEALGAAAAVGDDRIQATTTGRVNPENWTHGSSEQRVQWFNTGYTYGDVSQCRL